MTFMEDFENNHGLHGLLIGGVVYWVTDSVVAGVATGGGLYWYMDKFGHTLEPIKNILQ